MIRRERTPPGHIESQGYVLSDAEKLYGGKNGPLIDLGLATSPIGHARDLRLRFREGPLETVSLYSQDPQQTEVRKMLLAAYDLDKPRVWQGVYEVSQASTTTQYATPVVKLEALTSEQVVFSNNGSYGAGDEVTRQLARHGIKRIIAPVYSFPNVSQWAHRHGLSYETSPTDDLDPHTSLEKVLTMDTQELMDAAVYMDYPNNPFGIVDPSLVRKITDHVLSNGGIPFIDLAFGEVLGDEFGDIIQYVTTKGGFALGSLSKTQGIPGLRIGYSFLPSWITEDNAYEPDRLVFAPDALGETILRELFTKQPDGSTIAKKHARNVSLYNSRANQIFLTKIAQLGVTIEKTDMRTPIQVIRTNNNNFWTRLAEEGIVTESLAQYSITLNPHQKGYEDSAVRILTPGWRSIKMKKDDPYYEAYRDYFRRYEPEPDLRDERLNMWAVNATVDRISKALGTSSQTDS